MLLSLFIKLSTSSSVRLKQSQQLPQSPLKLRNHHPCELQSISTTSTRSQRGFTLIELMVALMVFAMLAVVGWQVFDGLNRAKDRAQIQAKALSDLQYAYLQMQNDFSQVVVWSNGGDVGQAIDEKSADVSGLSLSMDGISFVRFADPDPRYQTTPTLIRVAYSIVDGKLIRRQMYDVNSSGVSVSGFGAGNSALSTGLLAGGAGNGLDTLMLSAIDNLTWKTVESETNNNNDQFITGRSNISRNNGSQTSTKQATEESNPLPKGISVSFDYDGQAIFWQFALPNAIDARSLSSENSASNEDVAQNRNSQDNPKQNNASNANGNSENNNNGGSQSSNKELDDEGGDIQ